MIYREKEEKHRTAQSLIGGAMVLTVAMVAVKVIGVFYRLPLQIILGGDGWGSYTQAYTFYGTVYAVMVTGFPVAISKIVAGYVREGRYRDVRRTVRVANLFFLAMGTAGSAGLLLFARTYAVSVLENENVFYSLIAVAPSIVFSCLMSVHRGYQQGMRNMTPTAVSQIVEVVVKSAAGLVGAYLIKAHFQREYLDFGTVLGQMLPPEGAEVAILSLAAAGAIFGVTVSTVAGWIFLQLRHMAKGDGISAAQLNQSPEAQSGGYLLRQILTVGVPVALGSVTVALTGQIDSMMIQSRLIDILGSDPALLFASHGGWLEQAGKHLFSDPGAIATFLYGCYGLGFAFFNLVPAVTGSFGMSALPHITDSWLANDRPATKRHIESTLKITMLFAAPAGFGIAALAEPILHLFFSKTPAEVAIGGPMLGVLGFASVFLALNGPVNSMLQAIGRLDIPVKLLVLGGALKMAVNYILVGIPSVNIKAAPVGTLLCYAMIAAVSIVALYKNTGIAIDWKGAIAKPFLSGAVSGAVALGAYELQLGLLEAWIRPKVATLTAIALAVAAYVVCIAVFRVITREDTESMPNGKKMAKILEKLHIIR